ncbi:hypothetical protein PybrP1_012932, partial [[Pythium] brassicae (nom. inval.)]
MGNLLSNYVQPTLDALSALALLLEQALPRHHHGARRRGQDHAAVPDQARRGGHRLQRRELRVQERRVHSMGHRRSVSPALALAALPPEHGRRDLRRRRGRPRARRRGGRGAPPALPVRRPARRETARVREQAGPAREHEPRGDQGGAQARRRDEESAPH